MAKKAAAKAKPASTKKSITPKKKPAPAKKKAAAKVKAAPKKKAAKLVVPRERVSGIGGVFFKSKNPAKLAAWYAVNLGIAVQDWGGAAFEWIDPQAPMSDFRVGKGRASTVWSPFDAKTDYFGAGPQGHMVNYRVRDLDAMLAQLRSGGAKIAKELEESDFGRFAWGIDPDGNRFELWEPPAGK